MYIDALTTTVTVVIASTSVGLPRAPGWNNEVLPPPLILKDIMMGLAGFAALPQH